MKQLLFILAVICSGCVEKSVDFLEPQPVKTKNLKQFPQVLWGIYESLDGDSKLEIKRTLIIESGSYDIKLSKAELDTSKEYVLKDNVLISVADNSQIPIIQKNDSLFGFVPWTDTAFYISEKNILRKLKGFYFLNEFNSDSVWKLVRLKPEKNLLILSTMNKKKEVLEIERLTDLYQLIMNGDSITSYKLKPTKKEFKKMVSDSLLFTDQKKFLRVRP